MKKSIMSVLLLLLFCIPLLTGISFADGEGNSEYSTPPTIYDLRIVSEEDGSLVLQVKIQTPASVSSLMSLLRFADKSHYISSVQFSYSLEGGGWQDADARYAGSGDQWNGVWRTGAVSGLTESSWVQVRVRYTGIDSDGAPVLSNWSDTLVINESEKDANNGSAEDSVGEPDPAGELSDFAAHDWAKPELTEADGLGLIPAGLRSADLKEPITRAEFAAVSVKVYEALGGLSAKPSAENPFTDTADVEVLKAFNVGVTNGVSDTEFAPDRLLNREQAATMLSRVYKKVAFEGWTLGTDGDFAEAFRALFTMPEAFTDDADISSWARDSVYFMAANGILKGMEGGTFQPRAVTEEQQAVGYAQATREQAILIAVRLVKNLGA